MKILLWVLALLGAAPGFAATVEFHLNDFRIGGSLSNRLVYITPTTGVGLENILLIIPERQIFRTDADGGLTVSNMVARNYRVDVVGSLVTNMFLIAVPSGADTINAVTITAIPLTESGLRAAYTTSASDLRYARTTGGSFTNVELAGTLTYRTGASPGYVLVTDGTLATWQPFQQTGQSNTLSSVGTGLGLVAPAVGVDHRIKGVIAAGFLSGASNATDLILTGLPSGETNTLGSSGTGVSLVAAKTGTTLMLKSPRAAAHITITPSAGDELDFATTGLADNTSGSHTNPTVVGSLTLSPATASRALITDASQRVTNSPVTSAELGYLSGVPRALLSMQQDNAYNVLDYGAARDGVTDALAAIQSAVNAVPATGGSVYLPPGTYLVTNSIRLPSNVRFYGAGPGATRIKLAPNSNSDVIRNADQDMGNDSIIIENLYLDGNRTNQSSAASDGPGRSLIGMVNVKNSTVREVSGTSPTHHGCEFSVSDIAFNAYRPIGIASTVGNFAVSQTVTGLTSLATATILVKSNNFLTLYNIAGVFQPGEFIGSASATGTVTSMSISNRLWRFVNGNSVTGATSLATATILSQTEDYFILTNISGIFGAAETLSGPIGTAAVRGAIPVPGCRNCIIENCRFQDFGDDGVTTHWANNIIISKCVSSFAAATYSSSSNGVEIDDGSDTVTINDCVSYRCAKGFQIQGHANRQAARNVTVNGCLSISNSAMAYQLSATGTNASPAANVTLNGCVARGGAGIAIDCYSEVSINGCTVEDAGTTGIYLTGSPTNFVQGIGINNCTFVNSTVTSSGTLTNISGVNFRGCTFTAARTAGYVACINMSLCNLITVENCLFFSNSVRCVYLANANGCAVNYNKLWDNYSTESGIRLVSANDSEIIGNLIRDSYTGGSGAIYVHGSQTNLTIALNRTWNTVGGVNALTYGIRYESTGGNSLIFGNQLSGSSGPLVIGAGTTGTGMLARDNVGYMTGRLYESAVFKGPTNTTTETSIVGATGFGTTTLPASWWVVGRTLKVEAAGFLNTFSTAPALTVCVKLGATKILTNLQTTLPASLTMQPWTLRATIRSSSYNASGTVYGSGEFVFGDGTSTNRWTLPLTVAVPGTETTLNTTAGYVVDAAAAFSTANAANFLTCTEFRLFGD